MRLPLWDTGNITNHLLSRKADIIKIFNAKVQNEGINKNGKAYKKIGFQDESGKWYSSFDEMLLNVTNGQWVDGKVEQNDYQGKTYFNFKMSNEQSQPLQLSPVPSGADKAVQKAPVSQDVWDKKDRAMAWMNCNNAAATLFSSTGQGDEHIKHLKTLFALYESQINGQQSLSENFARVLEQVPTPVVAGPPTPPAPTNEEPPAEINLDDIPF